MTTVYEEYEELVVKYREVKTTCDRCGVVIPDLGANDSLDFELKYVKGESHPDDWSGSGWCVEDLCDACMVLLKELLEANGFKLTSIEY